MSLKTDCIDQISQFVKNSLAHNEAGHSWSHTWRVWQLSKYISQFENADSFIVEAAALLHDIADAKFHDGDETVGPAIAGDLLSSLPLELASREHILNIIRNVSFRGGNRQQDFRSIELDIVQDADRLDAMGAIGIARTFHYGGYRNREIYNPEIPPNLSMTPEEYLASSTPSINHFYEKLLLLKDRMNTESGRIIAQKRHDFMEAFLAVFHQEWHCELTNL